METTIGAIPVGSQPQPQPQSRDQELVGFVGRHGVVTIGHVMAALGLGRATAYRRAAACIEARLLERLELLHFEPSLLRATRAGLRYAGLGLPTAVVSPASVDHRLRCASTAQLLAAEFGAGTVLTERELVAAERAEGRPVASARLSARRLHRPDLAVLSGARTVAVEVELNPKGPRRLGPIVRAWQQADWVSEVRYYCAPGPTRRGVERAVEKADAPERIRIFDAVSP
jgi:hypothetical protein